MEPYSPCSFQQVLSGLCQHSIAHELTESCRKESKMIDSASWLVRPTSILTVEPQNLTLAR